MTYQAVQTLPPGAWDIIGDVHGEWAALCTLLGHLGYAADGSHPQGRRLVFVGDLCDRGPDSPAVLAWFKQAYDAGRALMVLGNHELNLLVDDAKDGSGWFFDRRAERDSALYAPWVRAERAEKAVLADWLAQMPLVLQRGDLRIVHAAWLPEQIARLETHTGGLAARYRTWDEAVVQALEGAPWYADYMREQRQYGREIEDPDRLPPPMPATAQFELARSRLHPIRALTSGVEQIVARPFFAAGRWRFTGRCRWWADYDGEAAVVIGHYWRHWYPKRDDGREVLFPEANNAWLGRAGKVFCVDYSVGARWRDRQSGLPPERSAFRLAALRWPERTLMFDDGSQAPTVKV
ncbi:metallophosphoesterase [Neisseria leonii]|uniref:metallophosphoesterase n=1 Tax=Neisseria leonii TaxID=2995413 RepID=UPI00237B3D82|nr:metallophosphoesterase [Neisseria sp. 3986]MDD9325069.1 metallophosphoesterase [Neisseria sp. 3986]